MKERLAEIIRLAYEVNDLMGLIYVSIDVSRYGATVSINTLNKRFTHARRTTYWSPTQYRDEPYMEEWIIDPGLVKAEKELKEILDGGKAA